MSPGMMIAAQCRAARGLLAWSLEDLAAETGIAADRLAAFEDGAETPDLEDLLTLTFERAGIAFIPEDEQGGAGLRLRRPDATAAQLTPAQLNASNDE